MQFRQRVCKPQGESARVVRAQLKASHVALIVLVGALMEQRP